MVTRLIGIAVFLSSVAGCEEDPPAPTRPALTTEAREELAEEADLEPAPTSAWPSDTTGLLESLEAVESVDSCRARLREQMPVEVAEVMADLSYAQVIDDVCAGLVAVRDRSPEGCDALSVTAQKRGCRKRLALVAGEPSLCPDATVMPGRDPVCVAWAARDPGLCRAAPISEEARCRAVLSGDARGCRSHQGGDRARCEAEVARYASALGEERNESAAAEVEPLFRATAEVEREGAAREPIAIEERFLDRGVHLEARGCGHRLSLSDPAAGLPSPVSFTDRPPRMELELDVPAEPELPYSVPLGATTGALRVVLPGIGEATSLVGAEGSVTITEFDAERGGLIAGRIEGELSMTPGRVRVRGEFRTFVRDLEAPRCGGGGR